MKARWNWGCILVVAADLAVVALFIYAALRLSGHA